MTTRWALAFALAAGCSSSDSKGPICAAGTYELDGTIAGMHESATGASQSYIFSNALGGSPGTLDVSLGGAGTLHLQWTQLVPDDGTTQATGSLAWPDTRSLQYCITSGTITPRKDAEGGGVSFVASALATGTCPGMATGGSIDGCAAP